MAKRLTTCLLVAVVAGLLVAAASWASPGTHQYGNPVTQEKPPPAVRAPVVDAAGSTLPFTGLEIGLIVAGGCAVAGAGFVLRRTTRGDRT